jgi:hypothetical protein
MSDYIAGYFKRYHGQSITRERWQSVDVEGNPIPWMTYSAIFQLEQLDFSACNVFEWGSGYSSLYWASRCRQITTVEHDLEWINFVRTKPQPNLVCHSVELGEYASFIDTLNNQFDLIVVDGYIHDNMRMRCVDHATKWLREGGLLVLDNSDWLPNTCDFLRRAGFNQSDYAGFGPINNYPWCTSLFFKQSLRIPRRQISPGFVPGGIKNARD